MDDKRPLLKQTDNKKKKPLMPKNIKGVPGGIKAVMQIAVKWRKQKSLRKKTPHAKFRPDVDKPFN